MASDPTYWRHHQLSWQIGTSNEVRLGGGHLKGKLYIQGQEPSRRSKKGALGQSMEKGPLFTGSSVRWDRNRLRSGLPEVKEACSWGLVWPLKMSRKSDALLTHLADHHRRQITSGGAGCCLLTGLLKVIMGRGSTFGRPNTPPHCESWWRWGRIYLDRDQKGDHNKLSDSSLRGHCVSAFRFRGRYDLVSFSHHRTVEILQVHVSPASVWPCSSGSKPFWPQNTSWGCFFSSFMHACMQACMPWGAFKIKP